MNGKNYTGAFGGGSSPVRPPEDVAYMGSLEQQMLQKVQTSLDGTPQASDIQQARELLQIMIDSCDQLD